MNSEGSVHKHQYETHEFSFHDKSIDTFVMKIGNKMASILRIEFSNAFSLIKTFFWLKFYRNSFPMV